MTLKTTDYRRVVTSAQWKPAGKGDGLCLHWAWLPTTMRNEVEAWAACHNHQTSSHEERNEDS